LKPGENQTSKNLKLKRTKSIGRIDYKEEDGDTSTMPDGSMQVNLEGFINVLVVQRSQSFLRSESLGGSDG
jgi:hypothetical protein